MCSNGDNGRRCDLIVIIIITNDDDLTSEIVANAIASGQYMNYMTK